jgi:hypothetical protein
LLWQASHHLFYFLGSGGENPGKRIVRMKTLTVVLALGTTQTAVGQGQLDFVDNVQTLISVL